MGASAASWIGLFTPGLALAGFVVSLISLCVSVANYRRAGAIVRGRFFASELVDDVAKPRPAPVELIISATNKGLAGVEVKEFRLEQSDRRGNFRWRFYVSDCARLVEGEKPSCMLQGQTTRHWVYDLREMRLSGGPERDAEKMLRALLIAKLVIELGNGDKVVRAPGMREYAFWLAEPVLRRLLGNKCE